MSATETLDRFRIATEALDSSHLVLSELNRQCEIRTRTTETLISTDCIVDQQNITLASMSENRTLLGRFLSLFTPAAHCSQSQPTGASRYANGSSTAIASDDYEAPSCTVSPSLDSDLKEHSRKEDADGVDGGDELKSVHESVLKLRDASLEIKELLERDAMALQGSSFATTDMIDKNAINSILITRMQHRYSRFDALKSCTYSYIGTFRFEALVSECQAPFFLAVCDKKLCLVTCSGEKETAFACFSRNDNRSIVAMKSVSTDRFVGIDFLGNVCVAADKFGSYEDLYVPALSDSSSSSSASRRTGGIVVMERHFGRGAWIKSVEIKATTHHYAYYLNRTTSCVHDKEHRLMVKAYPCSASDYDYLP